MNILVTLNSNYVEQLTVMLRSLMATNRREYFDIYVAHSSLTQQDFRRIADSLAPGRCTLHPIKIKHEILEGAPVLDRISKETYYRLLAPEYLPKSVDRILYIDPDTVIMNELKPLYDIDFGDNLIAGATHVYSFIRRYNQRRLKMGRDSQYINAGVMMMNIAGLRKSYTSSEIFDYIEKNGKNLYLADQDVINALYCDKTIALPPEIINMDEKTLRLKRRSLDWVESNTLIVHYDGKMKPWKPDYKGCLDVYYRQLSRTSAPIRLTALVGA